MPLTPHFIIFFTLTFTILANSGTGSVNGGIFQPGCLINPDAQTNANGACTYQNFATSHNIERDCLSGFWKIYEPVDPGQTKFYCASSCSVSNGFTPDYRLRTCTSSITIGTQCPISQRTLPGTSWCSDCPTNCLECDGDLALCLSCKNGYYFDVASKNCVPKSYTAAPSLRVFVSADYDFGHPNDHDGSANSPFYDIRDALTYINEQSAPYATRQAFIYLEKGVHHITLRDQETTGYAMHNSQDFVQMEYDLTIQPLYCDDTDAGVTDTARCHDPGEKVSIRNKLGAYFYFDVPRSLTLNNLIFDSADSMGTWSDNCLGLKQDTCGYDFSANSILTYKSGCCSAPSQFLEHCNFDNPTSFIRIRYTPANSLAQPKALTISNCEFQNFFYQMNSLIQYPREGANIQISNTAFRYFSTCGGIIKNKFNVPYDTGYRQIGGNSEVFNSYIAQIEAFKEYPQSQISTNAYNDGTLFNPFTGACASQSTNKDCHNISITGSTFESFDVFFSTADDVTLMGYGTQRIAYSFHQYTPQNVNTVIQRYRGVIIQLENYPGSLTIQGSTFNQIIYPAKACFNQEYGSLSNSVEGDFLYKAQNNFKVEMPIIVTNSKGKFIFSRNTVTRASGSKGFMFIEMSTSFDRPSVIYQNTFFKVSGFVYSGILNLRLTFSGTNRSFGSSSFCGGFLVSDNQFKNSVLCPKFIKNDNYPRDGFVKFSCRVIDINENDQVYQDSAPYWTPQNPLDYSQNFVTMEVFPAVSLEVDTKITTFKNNIFERNVRGPRGSMILVQSMPFMKISNTTYSQNFDVILAQFGGEDIQQDYGGFRATPVVQMYQSTTGGGTVDSNTGALITVTTGHGVEISGDKFEQSNWKNDYPFQHSAAYLHTYYTRGRIQVREMATTIPPTGICSAHPQSLVSQQAVSYEMKCGLTTLPDQAFQPFFKFEHFNDLSHTPVSEYFQTDFILASFSLSYFQNTFGALSSFIEFNNTAGPFALIHLNLTSVMIQGANQRGDEFLDLRGVITDITNLTINTLGNPTISANYIFRLGDQVNNLQANRFTFSDVTLENVHATKSIIHLNSETNTPIDVKITNLNSIGCFAFDSLFTTLAERATVALDGWNVDQFTIGNLNVDIFYEFVLTDYASFTITRFTHVCNLAKSRCRVLLMNANLLWLTITNSDFSMADANGASVASANRAAPFSILADRLIFANNSFHGYQEVSKEGGVFSGQIGTLLDTNSSYYLNKGASAGGVFYLTSTSTSNFTDCHFYNNEANDGGVFELSNNITLTLNNCTFNGNKAKNSGGCLRVFGSSLLKSYSSRFYSNSASGEGGVMFFFSSEASEDQSVIQDTQIYKNRLPNSRNPITVLYSNMLFKNVSFYENLALEGSHNLYIGFSTVTISRCKFYVQDQAFQYMFTQEETLEGIVANSAGLSVGENSKVTIQDSLFQNSTGVPTMLNIQGYSIVSVNNSTFRSLSAEYGAGIQGTGFEKLNVSNSQFWNNEASVHGSDIYISNTKNSVYIHNVTFTASGGTSIYLTDGDIYITESLFTSQDYINVPGGLYAIDCLNCITLDVQRTNFTHLRVDNVIHIDNSSLLFQSNSQQDTAQIHFKDSLFHNITYGVDGGAIHAVNYNLILLDGNTFDSISSFPTIIEPLRGGALYTDGKYLRYIRLKSNQFKTCASDIGGAIYYAHYEPQIQPSNTFFNNSASIYGDNIAAYPVNLGFADQASITRNLVSFNFDSPFTPLTVQGEAILSSFSFSNVKSGGILPTFHVVVLDKYGQIVRSQSNNRLTVTLQNIHSSSYAPVATLASDVYSASGIFTITGLIAIAEPGTTVRLKIGAVNLFDTTLPDVIAYQAQNAQSLLLTSTLSTRLCIPGQAFLSNGQCSSCKSGSQYMLQAAQGPNNCLACPDKANCFGGADIGPKPGYWRASNTSINFQSCLNPTACLGRLSISYSQLGNCTIGYRGILCAQCEQNYSRDSQFQCAPCPEPWRNILIICFITLLTLTAIVFLVKYTISSANSQKSPFSIYMKVLINHLQLVFLTSSFDLSWPDQVNAFYEQTRPLATVSEQIVSLDCLLASTTIQSIGRFYIYLLVYLILPILVAFLSLLVWWIKIRTNKKRICNRSTATIIIILFLLHPSITNAMFNAFYCRDVDGTRRLVQELDQKCFQGRHLWWGLLGGLPGLVCWAIGIPAFAWVLLSENKMQLGNTEMKEKFGFLYKGYKLDSFYWECVIMYRKVAMIFISVFLNGIGTMVQALVVMILLVFFIIITLRKKPYYSRKLNDLELVSLVTSCITFYCGLYFLSSKHPDDPSYVSSKDFFLTADAKWFFFSIIIIANLCFFLFWMFSFLGDVRHKFRDKCPRFYVCLCLCCRKGLLSQDIRHAKQYEAQELVIETIEQLERSLRSVRNMYIRRKDFVDRTKFQVLAFKTNREMKKIDTNDLLNGSEKNKPAFLGKVRVAPSNDPLCSLPHNQDRRKEREMIRKLDQLQVVEASFEQSESASVMVVDQDPYELERRLTEIRKQRSKLYKDSFIEIDSPKSCNFSQDPLQIVTEDGSAVEALNSKGTLINFNPANRKSFFAAPIIRRETPAPLKVELQDMLEQENVQINNKDYTPPEEVKEVYTEAKTIKENYKKLRANHLGFNESQECFLPEKVERKLTQKIDVTPDDIFESQGNYQVQMRTPVQRLQTEKRLNSTVSDLKRFKSRTERLRTMRHSEKMIQKKKEEEQNPLTTEDLSHIIDEFYPVGVKGSEQKESSYK